MANNIVAHAIGEDRKVLDASTVGEVRQNLNIPAEFVATLNGTPAQDTATLRDRDYVTFSRPVKGGM